MRLLSFIMIIVILFSYMFYVLNNQIFLLISELPFGLFLSTLTLDLYNFVVVRWHKNILHKFLSILDNFDLNVVARDIINQIIIQIFQAELSHIVTNTHVRYTTYLKKKYKNNKIDYSQYYPNFKYEPLDYIDKLRFPFSLPVMEIVKKVMLFYLKLLDQLNLMKLTEVIPLKIKSITLAIEDSPIYPIHEDEISREDMRICCRCLITVYEKYLDSN